MFKAVKDAVFLRVGKGGGVEVHVEEGVLRRWLGEMEDDRLLPAPKPEGWNNEQAAVEREAFYRSVLSPAGTGSGMVVVHDINPFEQGDWRTSSMGVGARCLSLSMEKGIEMQLVSVGKNGATFRWRELTGDREERKPAKEESGRRKGKGSDV